MIIYIVQDNEDKDRTEPIIDIFRTREEADKFAEEWSADFGHCTIVGAVAAAQLSFDNITSAAECHLKGTDAAWYRKITREEIVEILGYSWPEIEARYAESGMESLYCLA